MNDRTVRYQRNRHLLVQWEPDTGLNLLNYVANRKFRVKPALLELLDQLDSPRSAEQIQLRWSRLPRPGQLEKFLDQLTDAGFVDAIIGGTGEGSGDTTGCTPYERAVHLQAAQGARADRRTGEPPPARYVHHTPPIATIPLTACPATPSLPLVEVLAKRRSVRRYAARPLPLNTLAWLLHQAARVHATSRAHDTHGELGEVTQRPTPSGGARHSLEIYVIARTIEGLAAGAYHYDPFDHTLRQVAAWTDELAATLDETVTVAADMSSAPPASLYLASYAARTGWKYRGMALSLIYRDTGCLLQTLHLTATDLGLASCITAAIQAPLTAPFLRGRDSEFIHTGNLALGLPHDGARTRR